MTKRVVIIGAGNVAWSLAPAIDSLEGYEVTQVYGRTLSRARELASSMKAAVATDRVEEIVADAHIYIVSVKDDAIAQMVSAIKPNGALWLHTAGGVMADVLSPLTPDYGVMYPLQTFTRGIQLPMADVPLFVEGSTPEALCAIKELAGKLSATVTEADSRQRKLMHVAAVFGCNFTNYLWMHAQQILEANGMEFSVLRPLIDETLRKAMTISPAKGQTGPARRGDKELVESHLRELTGEKAEIYRLMSDYIMKHYNESH